MRFPLASIRCFAWLAIAVGPSAAVAANGNEAVTGTIVDDFSDASRWEATASDGVTLKCTAERAANAADPHATTLRLDYDFKSSGYAGVRHRLPLDLPPNFELAFSVRGELPKNNLEFKLVDETGAIVWWVNRPAFEFPREWTRLASRRRHFQFAWGPSSEPLRKAGALEIVVSSAEGGRGTIWLDDLTFRPLPESKPYNGRPTVTASSIGLPSSASFVVDGDLNTTWRSDPRDNPVAVTVDFGRSREFGGMVIHWDPDQGGPGYDVQFSDDGKDWTTVRSSATYARASQFLSFPDAEARSVRLLMDRGPFAGHFGIREIEFLTLEASRDANSFALEIARRAPRGQYPRAIGGEGTFWTIVGVPGDDHEALVSEDGAVEVDKQAFSIEPFLSIGDRLLTWADTKSTTQSLADGFAPVPTVTRSYEGLQLKVTAAADGEANRSSLTVLYTLTNTSDKPAEGSLILAARPFQVNPPYQWLNTRGGVARIDNVVFADGGRRMNIDNRSVVFSAAPDEDGAASFDEGDVVSSWSEISTGDLPDAQRAASAMVAYQFQLAAGESRSWAVRMPFSQDATVQRELLAPFTAARDPVAYVRERQAAVVEKWREATDSFELLLPPQAADVANTIRSTLVYILINQDGKAIHPGSRSYERSWIRDGSLTSAALLRFGMEKEAKEFVDWYGPFQFESGKVPCVVDHRGADPVPENDSHGQYIMAVMHVYRFTGDREFLERHWLRVQKAVAYIEKLRAERMTAEFAANTTATRQEKGKSAVSSHAFYGLMPESISHEGYSAKPMHSYWDDFFTLKGLKDAAEMARVLNEPETAARYQTFADDFAQTLYASLDMAMKVHQIDYIPGCVELGDFDATSTTISLWPCNELGRLPKAALANTFDQYWKRFVQRRDDPSFAWVDYTPYELRAIGSFVLLGQPERVQQALAFFMNDRRPRGWNQWPEVIHREPRAAKFIGDLPHTWCGSDFVNSVRMMFLWEREADDALVLLAGVPSEWVSLAPVGFRNLPTYGGRLTCTLSQSVEDKNNKLLAHLEGSCAVPAGKLRLSVPTGRAANATVNGAPAPIDGDGRVVVDVLPADVEVSVMPKTGR